MNRMNDFLNKISMGHVTITSVVAVIIQWITSNEGVLILTSFTVLIGALLALRKLVMVVISDSKVIINKIKTCFRDRVRAKPKEIN